MDYTGMMEGGPAISGCWINKNNNKVIEVRDFIMDGDKMFIIATDGSQVDGDDFSSNYYQVSAENKDAIELQNKIKNAKPPKPDPLFEGMDELVRETAPRKEPVSSDNPVLVKFFEKQQPRLSVSVDLTGIPREALKTLVEYLGVSVEELAEYLCRRAVPNKEEIIKQITEYV